MKIPRLAWLIPVMLLLAAIQAVYYTIDLAILITRHR